jgi:IMP cyclohydrolase
MIRKPLGEAMSASAYPGRGIVAGTSADGKAALAYFIMGRSVNSRNRVFSPLDGGIRTEAFDIAKVADPSLIIYAPVRVLGRHTIITNGDQTDTVYSHLQDRKTFEDALRTRDYEPDAPNYTPRVSALCTLANGGYSLKMCLIKAAGPEGGCARFFYEYGMPAAGTGYFLHTYRGDGSPLPSFEGEPEKVAVSGTLREFAREIWDGLDKDNRVSLWARMIDTGSGQAQDIIINKNK